MTVVYQGEQYTMGRLEDMDNAQLRALFNNAVPLFPEGSRPNLVLRFSDHAAAVRRTYKLLRELGEVAPSTSAAPTPKGRPQRETVRKAPVKERGMRFVFPVGAEIRDCTVASRVCERDTRSLRWRCRDLLDQGATFEQVKALVQDFDKERGKAGRPERLESRAYELVRIMHYYLGYGLSHDTSTGIIKLVHPRQ